MYKNLYPLVLVACLLPWAFLACKKEADKPEGGISYGIVGVEPLAASSGDTIRIYGAGFQTDMAANQVYINGVRATVTTATHALLEVLVPDGPRTGVVSVKSGSDSSSFTQPFNITTVLKGNLAGNLTLDAGKLYLLKGGVHVQSGAALTIPAGTVVMGEKKTLASLVIDEGAALHVNGTVEKPVVFTSDQPIGLRQPGDWKGIVLASSADKADEMHYARIEYAGFHWASEPGAALLINRNVVAAQFSYIQTSYSGGDGFRFNGGNGVSAYLNYLIAFGCAGNDFSFVGSTKVWGQFLTGVKDPNYADQYSADGVFVQSAEAVTLSNITLLGPNGLSRNAVTHGPDYLYYMNYDEVLNTHAGRGVHVGGYDRVSGAERAGVLKMFNSLVAAPWLAGIALDGPGTWGAFNNGGTVLKYNIVTYNMATKQTARNHDDFPVRGSVFGPENIVHLLSGFAPYGGTPQAAAFTAYNDTALLQLMTPFLNAPNPYVTYDDLGIANMAFYKNMTSMVMTPLKESALFTKATFTDAELNDPFFLKSINFRGSFGTTDWTKGWCNYVPGQTSYN